MARTPLMAGNWKMNVDHVQATALVQRLAWTLRDAGHDPAAVEVVVLPPFTDLRTVQTLVEGDQLTVGYGAQDASHLDSGARTGEVAPPMLARLGCRYVVVGHSERRQFHGEDDALVAAKAVAVRRAGMRPIVCVGEPLQVRREGRQVAHVLEQLQGSLAGLQAADLPEVVIAYEPVWAIGTGEVATPDDAQEVCSAIRRWLADWHGSEVADAVRVLYGGSVKSGNVAALMARPDVDGALVGGASLDAAEFAAICRFGDHVGTTA
ncbi:triose-phosphate isomerase [Quadrisphaera sp. DSM 44207]|uniref:triose-phosphate isomerase n=1 Tax=Quadrisphaera sp. DSM 44207 TaxID=1881057 RepID=UPI00087E6FC3|nr:triose-phosphate isomerase [Quadrisphaera sp. DSM 44207]SDQ44343.1 triosephosphate isomerase [Quadrisphaera sp. DSM 44207]